MNKKGMRKLIFSISYGVILGALLVIKAIDVVTFKHIMIVLIYTFMGGNALEHSKDFFNK